MSVFSDKQYCSKVRLIPEVVGLGSLCALHVMNAIETKRLNIVHLPAFLLGVDTKAA